METRTTLAMLDARGILEMVEQYAEERPAPRVHSADLIEASLSGLDAALRSWRRAWRAYQCPAVEPYGPWARVPTADDPFAGLSSVDIARHAAAWGPDAVHCARIVAFDVILDEIAAEEETADDRI